MYYFNSWDADCKHPFGAIKVGEIMKMNFIADRDDITVKFIIRRDFGQRHEFDMQKIDQNVYSSSVKFDVGHGLYFYYFEISEPSEWGTVKHYYGSSSSGGEGVLYMNEGEIKPYQVTAFDNEDPAPEWYRDSVFYQIFPDRFHNGNSDGTITNPKPNSFIYGSKSDEPFYVKNTDGGVERWDFFGGNLRGIIEKIPYLKTLGINALYLNPIFSGVSNHRYDTSDYLTIDSMLGTEEDFAELVKTLHENDMKIILDGVFSHVGKDSLYFNLSGKYGNEIGAAQNPESPYYEWFKFNHYPEDYKSWWGIKDLPEVDKDNDSFRYFIYGEENSVLNKWNHFGIDGWRLDVADELPDSFIRGIRKNLEHFPNTVLIGEVWEDASNKISYGRRRDYILGGSLHGVMNYPFRQLIMDYVNKAKNAHDVAHELMVLSENYPQDILYNNLNNLGTHDTERILTMIGLSNLTNAVGMMYSLPGVPCIYYGDEAGLTGGKDPVNRKYFPWEKIDQEIFELYQSWSNRRHDDETLRWGGFSTFYVENCLGILRYTDQEVSIYLMNPSNENIAVKFDDINFTQKFDFLDIVKTQLANLTVPAKGNFIKQKIKI